MLVLVAAALLAGLPAGEDAGEVLPQDGLGPWLDSPDAHDLAGLGEGTDPTRTLPADPTDLALDALLLPGPAPSPAGPDTPADEQAPDEQAPAPRDDGAEGLPVREPPQHGPVMPAVLTGLPCLRMQGDVLGATACPGNLWGGSGGSALVPGLPGAPPALAQLPRSAPIGITSPAAAPEGADVSMPAQARPGPPAPRPEAVQPRAAEPTEATLPVPAASVGGWDRAAAAALVPAVLALKLLLALVARRLRHASPRRQALLGLIHADPGIHHTELVRRSGFGNGAVQHHLRRLAEEGAVVRVRTAGHTCYFPAGTADPALVAVRTAARSTASRHVLAALARRPRSLSELARDVGLPVTTVHYHVGKLERAGAVVRSRAPGRSGRFLGVTPAGLRALGPQPAGAPPSGAPA